MLDKDSLKSLYLQIEEDLEKKLSGKDPKGFYQVSGAIDAAKGHLIHGVGRGKHRLVLTFSERRVIASVLSQCRQEGSASECCLGKRLIISCSEPPPLVFH